ncbi:MAG: hypothetical protein A4E49_00300 [Methanosaeta sp. PtaU1.Bin112]|nr:MAG: hypothetical protein A4E49_00300 [Methanosaeta sp. PtaU1.Bin112]
MRIDPNFNSQYIGGACVHVDMWNDEKLNDNPLCWDILHKMQDILSKNPLFENQGPRMYAFAHKTYNENPNIIECLKNAFNEAYETVMAQTIPATKDAKICDLENENKKLIDTLNRQRSVYNIALQEIVELRSKLSDREETIARYEEQN